MTECKKCKKTLNQEAGEIGSWCIDCIKNMSDTNTGNMELTRDFCKKEKRMLIILAIIGTVCGIIFGIVFGIIEGGNLEDIIISLIGGIWAGCGLLTSLGYFFSGLGNAIKMAKERGEFIGEALKSALFVGIFFFLLGLLGGILFFLFFIIRRNIWIKKLNKVIASENAVIAELGDYTLGKNISKTELSRKVNIIAGNYKWATEEVNLKNLKKLKVAK